MKRLFDRTSSPPTVKTLFVREAGAGPPVVLLHGLASSSRYWAGNAGLLVNDYHVLMPDLLGFGRSPKPFASTYSADEHVAWLHRALARFGDAPMALVGHSLGSIVALQYAAIHPLRVTRLALISLPVIGCLPWGHGVDGTPKTIHRLMAHTALGARVAGAVIRTVAPVGQYVAPRIQRDVPREAAMDSLKATAASYWRTLEQVVYGTDVAKLVHRVRTPLLLIHGARDHTAPLEAVRDLAASSLGMRLQIIPGAGHNPWHTHPNVTAGLLREFLAEPLPMLAPAAG